MVIGSTFSPSPDCPVPDDFAAPASFSALASPAVALERARGARLGMQLLGALAVLAALTSGVSLATGAGVKPVAVVTGGLFALLVGALVLLRAPPAGVLVTANVVVPMLLSANLIWGR